jgi:ribosomal 50S subunit-recycling heat shock protein
VRLTREGNETRIDKCARPLRIGDRLVFAVGGRLTAVELLGFGERRGPPAEARTLYRAFEAQDEVGPGPA